MSAWREHVRQRRQHMPHVPEKCTFCMAARGKASNNVWTPIVSNSGLSAHHVSRMTNTTTTAAMRLTTRYHTLNNDRFTSKGVYTTPKHNNNPKTNARSHNNSLSSGARDKADAIVAASSGVSLQSGHGCKQQNTEHSVRVRAQ